MVDSAVILDNIKDSLSRIYAHLKVKGLEICLNNVIFKWLVTLFLENTNETINLPIIDSLLLFGYITLYKASILLLDLAEDEILKCENLGDASIFFDEGLKDFKHKKFTKCLFNKDLFDIKIEEINKSRNDKFPKIKENIKQINEFEKKKKKKLLDSKCNIDWPYCVQILGHTRIIDVMKYKIIEKPLIESDYFDVNHNVYKLAETGEEEQKNALKESEKEKDDEKRKTLIYGNLLIERLNHKCNSQISSRTKILGENSGKKSSLMGSFFEACKKKDGDDNTNISYASDDLINIISSKNEIDHTKFIEDILENDDNKKEISRLRKGSWFKKAPTTNEDNIKDK